MRSTFPVERKKPEDKYRRWEAACFGEIYQHDSTPRHIWGPAGAQQHVILSLDDASRKVTARANLVVREHVDFWCRTDGQWIVPGRSIDPRRH